jgi:acetoin utilization deacetylase AcuC-like enzyme
MTGNPFSAIFGEIFSRHTIGFHDESASRIEGARDWFPVGTTVLSPKPAKEAELERVHSKKHVSFIRELSALGGDHFIDPVTYVTAESFEVASYAAGSAIQSVNEALSGTSSFALVRPPGHHAGREQAMGFCLFNNAAVAAAHALTSVGRVAIIDWDLHHGNGTQEIFYEDDRVLFCSIHAAGIFPGTGWVDEVGTGRGTGFTINAPLLSGCGLADYEHVFENAFIPAIKGFSPDLIIISAGMDPLADDPKNSMRLAPYAFTNLTALLASETDHGMAFVLEGGYGPSLGHAVHAVFEGLSAEPGHRSGSPRGSTCRLVAQIRSLGIW